MEILNKNTFSDENVTIEKKTPFFTKWWFVGSVGMLIGYLVL